MIFNWEWTINHFSDGLCPDLLASRYQLIVPRHRRFDTCSAVGHSLLSGQWPGTLCLTISVTQHLVTTSLEQYWRHTFFPSTKTCSALEASCLIALYTCTITYLLTSSPCYPRLASWTWGEGPKNGKGHKGRESRGMEERKRGKEQGCIPFLFPTSNFVCHWQLSTSAAQTYNSA